MTINEYEFPSGSGLEPCPLGCGRMTEDEAGGPCQDEPNRGDQHVD